MAAAVAVSIARASLRGGLLRPDPTPVPLDQITFFHTLLNKALTICSPSNIQNCKRWILRYVTSRPRVILLGKYLVALSPSLTKPPSGPNPSPRRQRLHVLYLVNDILHHTSCNEPSPTFPEEVKPFLKDLFTTAVTPGAIKQLAKIERLLDLWSTRSYYPSAFITELLASVRDAAAGTKPSSSPREKPVAGRPLLLPPFHGDPSLPFYDLPAANILPHLMPNSPTPINPRLVKPIQFSTLTPNEPLAVAVKDFLASVEGMFTGADIGAGDPDAVGGLLGGAGDGEGYYGWSRSFCEKMKMKKRAAMEGKSNRSEGRDRDRGRRRGSYSDSERSGSYSRSRSRSRSRSGGQRRYRESRSRSPSSRSRSRSPARPSFGQSQPLQGIPPPPPPQQQQQQQHLNYPPELPQQQQQQHYPPQGFPPPPPMPPYGYPQQQYPWPPPPPPPGFHQMMQQQQFQGYGYAGVGAYQWPQPQQGFLPMPQPVQQQQQQQADGEQGVGGQGGYEDYRSAKGREIGARRGWKT